MPGYKATALGSGDFKWLLHTHGIRDAVTTATFSVSTFTKATHYKDGFFPSGLPCNIADPKAVKPWTGAAGEELAFLFGDVPTDGVENVAGAFLFHGSIRTSFLPVAFTVPTPAPANFKFTKGA